MKKSNVLVGLSTLMAMLGILGPTVSYAASATQTVTGNVYLQGGSLSMAWVPSNLSNANVNLGETSQQSISGLYSGQSQSVLVPTETTVPISWASNAQGIYNGMDLSPYFDPQGLGLGSNTFTDPFSVTDATGTGAGWHVTVQATPLTEVAPSGGFANGTSALQIATGNVFFRSEPISSGNETTGTNYPLTYGTDNGPTGLTTSLASANPQLGAAYLDNTSEPISSTGGPYVLGTDQAIDTGSPLTFLDTQPGFGMGAYGFQNALYMALGIPGTTPVDSVNYAGQPTPYQTQITFSVVSGP